jgi:hypothetical protein
MESQPARMDESRFFASIREIPKILRFYHVFIMCVNIVNIRTKTIRNRPIIRQMLNPGTEDPLNGGMSTLLTSQGTTTLDRN